MLMMTCAHTFHSRNRDNELKAYIIVQHQHDVNVFTFF